jgi:hypothetical protein
MSEAEKLFSLFQSFNHEKRQMVLDQYYNLFEAFPEKRNQTGGIADLWLSAIADIRDGKSPWF